MELDFALDALYNTGWNPADDDTQRHRDGRRFPAITRIKDLFTDQGFDLAIKHIQLFDCYRAEWRDASSQPLGAVVGQSETEAAVYALAQLRRQVEAAKV
jgi:hypothetical protein